MIRLALILLALSTMLVAGPATFAQDAEAPGRIEGRILPNAPPQASALRDKLAEEIRGEAEFYADMQGALSVHPGVKPERLRRLAQWIEKQDGVRQALTDTPRRMILIIFSTAPERVGPESVAGPLERLRANALRVKKLEEMPLDGPAPTPLPEMPAPPKNPGPKPSTGASGARPGDPDSKPPVEGSRPLPPAPSEPERDPAGDPSDEDVDEEFDPELEGEAPGPAPSPDSTPRKPESKPVLPRKPGSYSFSPQPLDDAAISSARLSGEVTGKRALQLWLDGKDQALAVVLAREVLVRHPKDIEAGAVLAMFHLNRGREAKAYRNMRTILHYRPNVALYQLMYAEVLESLKLKARAQEAKDRAAELDQKFPPGIRPPVK